MGWICTCIPSDRLHHEIFLVVQGEFTHLAKMRIEETGEFTRLDIGTISVIDPLDSFSGNYASS